MAMDRSTWSPGPPFSKRLSPVGQPRYPAYDPQPDMAKSIPFRLLSTKKYMEPGTCDQPYCPDQDLPSDLRSQSEAGLEKVTGQS